MTEKQLKDGLIFNFDNDAFCERTESDDLRGGYIGWNDRFNYFTIWFNGACIYTSRTFKASNMRLEKLFKKWGCEMTSKEEY